jgi:hypothetical protein
VASVVVVVVVVVVSVVVVVASVVVVSSVVGGLVLVVGSPVVDVPSDVVPVVPVPGPVVAVPPARVVRPGTSTSLPVPVSMMRAGAGAGAGGMLSPVPVDDPVMAGWRGGILAGDVRDDAARAGGCAATSLAARPSIIRVRPTASNTSNTNPPAMAKPTCA